MVAAEVARGDGVRVAGVDHRNAGPAQLLDDPDAHATVHAAERGGGARREDGGGGRAGGRGFAFGVGRGRAER